MYWNKMVNRNGILGDIDMDVSIFDILVFKMWLLFIKYIKNFKYIYFGIKIKLL